MVLSAGSDGETDVLKAEMAYYGQQEAYGGEKDLKTVAAKVWEDGQWQAAGTTYFRYYKTLEGSGSSSSSGGGQAAHLVKYVLGPLAYERLADDPEVSDPLAASDAQAAQYADHYFEYDEQRRVSRYASRGGSSSFDYSYAESGITDNYNYWKYRSVQTAADGTETITYSNYARHLMLSVLKSGQDQWCEYTQYDESGRPILKASTSAVSGYNEGYGDLVKGRRAPEERRGPDSHVRVRRGVRGWSAPED